METACHASHSATVLGHMTGGTIPMNLKAETLEIKQDNFARCFLLVCDIVILSEDH